MNQLQLFLPCAAGVEDSLAQEVHDITQLQGDALRILRGGVLLQSSWRDAMRLNMYSRLCQRVLVQLHYSNYRNENDLYEAASNVAWEVWFTPKETFKVEITAQHCPLQSLNFATLRIKDAIADRFRFKHGTRPSIATQWPDCRIHAHLTTDTVTLYIDTSGEPLFKRGWRLDTGDAPLKETLASAMVAASGWLNSMDSQADGEFAPFYDPCCGSGTVVIEAAQIACNIAAGSLRNFGFEKLLPYQPHVWKAIQQEAKAAELTAEERKGIRIFGSDVSFRMVDFASQNALRAGVADVVQLRGGDALQRMPPSAAGWMLLNPPYGERIEISGVAGQREAAQTTQGAESPDFFAQLATHWKKNYTGWTAHVLTPDLKLPNKMRLKESRRVPMWNGPLECRLFRFDMVAGSARSKPAN